MFGLGIWEILVILVLALIFIGPKKLPDIAQSLGKGLREFRKVSNDFKDAIDVSDFDVQPKISDKIQLTTPDEPVEAPETETENQASSQANNADKAAPDIDDTKTAKTDTENTANQKAPQDKVDDKVDDKTLPKSDTAKDE